ncbi:flagellar hook-length control protein [Ruegeria pomeroyi DSS-3]|uniref:Flagellar hook-length control protein n=2 Tax=Ruegeria pomeroyi TaxID=89184 RepID=Q5LMV0_RUEPO|nr:flagellar hook-length control protein [Ruegeria pomeroyi DSS-3]HCE69811.1 flagellar hook-length control protein FliK [Ruegeria sp.]
MVRLATKEIRMTGLTSSNILPLAGQTAKPGAPAPQADPRSGRTHGDFAAVFQEGITAAPPQENAVTKESDTAVAEEETLTGEQTESLKDGAKVKDRGAPMALAPQQEPPRASRSQSSDRKENAHRGDTRSAERLNTAPNVADQAAQTRQTERPRSTRVSNENSVSTTLVRPDQPGHSAARRELPADPWLRFRFSSVSEAAPQERVVSKVYDRSEKPHPAGTPQELPVGDGQMRLAPSQAQGAGPSTAPGTIHFAAPQSKNAPADSDRERMHEGGETARKISIQTRDPSQFNPVPTAEEISLAVATSSEAVANASARSESASASPAAKGMARAYPGESELTGPLANQRSQPGRRDHAAEAVPVGPARSTSQEQRISSLPPQRGQSRPPRAGHTDSAPMAPAATGAASPATPDRKTEPLGEMLPVQAKVRDGAPRLQQEQAIGGKEARQPIRVFAQSKGAPDQRMTQFQAAPTPVAVGISDRLVPAQSAASQTGAPVAQPASGGVDEREMPRPSAQDDIQTRPLVIAERKAGAPNTNPDQLPTTPESSGPKDRTVRVSDTALSPREPAPPLRETALQPREVAPLLRVAAPLPHEVAPPLREAETPPREAISPRGEAPMPLREVASPPLQPGVRTSQAAQPAVFGTVAPHQASVVQVGVRSGPAMEHRPDQPLDIALAAPTTSGISPAAAPPATPAEAARQIAGQLATAVTNQPDSGSIEIALDPEELGRVQMNLKTRGDILTLTIATDRPETLDLMRRHIDQLATEFREMGYKDIAFNFGGSQTDARGGGHGQPGDDAHAGQPLDIEHTGTTPDRPRISAGGLDMRL